MSFRVPLLLLLLLCFLAATATSDLASDRAALLRLASAVRGRTRFWNQSNPSPCSWAGVSCDNNINRVTSLRLPGNGLTGEIPPNTIGNLTQLRILSLRRNSLSGPIPSDLGSCTELRFLYLQENQLSGEIPATLFTLTNLVRISLAQNSFSGEVSPAFDRLFRLRTLLLDSNQLTGSLPELSNLTLTEFNVSFNRLNGSIPARLSNFPANSFLGNSLCGSPLNSCSNGGDTTTTPPTGGNSLSTGAIVGIAIGSAAGAILVITILFILCRRSSSTTVSETSPQQRDISSIPPSPEKPPEYDHYQIPNSIAVRDYNESMRSSGRVASGRVESVITKSVGEDGLVFFKEEGDDEGEGVGFSLEELLKASAEVLGKGIIGTTYKAYLERGGEVIVKRLKNVPVSEKEFRDQIEGLGVLVHPNLVPLRGYYYGREEKLIVYQWMPMGNLSAILHGNRGGYKEELTWEVRSSIAYQVALGVEYLHSLGPNVTHGNIKSSNVFLTEGFGARISEFGISQLVSFPAPDLHGHHAPEVIESSKISQKADVYSFGVLVLELLSGKNASNVVDDGEGKGVDLPKWVKSVVEERWTINVFDPDLLKYQYVEDEMVRLLHFAVYCTSQHPDRRPRMAEVTAQIRKICGARLDRKEPRPYRS